MKMDQQLQMEELKESYEVVCRERDKALEAVNLLKKRLIKAEDEVARLVALCDGFKDQLRDADAKLLASGVKYAELLADYDARGRVIKKLRKRLHKLKKKLKH